VVHALHCTSHRGLRKNDHVDLLRQLFQRSADLRVMRSDVPIGEELKRPVNKHIVDHDIFARLACLAPQQICCRHQRCR